MNDGSVRSASDKSSDIRAARAAEPGGSAEDAIRSLRGWLKRGLRDFGLRCVSIEEVKVKQENNTMDMRKYTSGVIMPEDLHAGSRQERIIHVYINEKHNVPVLELESGDQLFAWGNIGRTLGRAYGWDDKDWLGHTVELSLGTYTNRDGETKENIVLKPISSRDDSSANGGAPKRVDPANLPAPVKRASVADDLNDDVPY